MEIATRPAPPAAPPRVDRRPHAIVIGSGFGGLAAAVRLGARGYRVTVLEKLDAPGGRAYVYRQDGFTFDAGPTIVTAPFLFEELWRLCGRRLADDVDLRPMDPVLPDPLPRRHDVRLQRRSRRDARARSRASRRATSTASSGSCARARPSYRVGFEQLGHAPFRVVARHAARRCPTSSASKGYRTVYGLVAQLRARSAAARDPELPSAARRRQSVRDDVGLHADLVPRAALGRALRDGRHRHARARPREPHRGAGRHAPLQCARWRRSSCATARPPACASRRARCSPPSIVVSNADSAWTYRHLLPAHARKRWTDRTDREVALLDEPVRLVLRHAAALRRRRAPHDHARSALSRTARRTSSSARCWRTTSACTCTGRRRPIRRSRRRGATRSTCCRRCRTWAAASTGATRGGSRTARAIAAHLSATLLPGLEREVVTSRVLTPQDFQDRLLVVPRRRVRTGAGAHAERVVPAAQPERGRRAPLPRRRGHASRRGTARRALVGARARHGGARCRRLRLSAHRATLADFAACRALLRDGSRTFLAASFLLPRGVRTPACALYAFCRVADDAVDRSADPVAALAGLRDAARRDLRRARRCRSPPTARSRTSSRASRFRARCPTRCSKASRGTWSAGATRTWRRSRTTRRASPARSAR